MGEFAQVLVRSGRVSVGFGEQALKGITPQLFARKPSPGGKTIDTNHPAFVYGHLATYPARWLPLLGLDPQIAPTPAGFDELFGAGKECRDDPVGTVYPPMNVITEAFFHGHRAALEAMGSLDDAVLRGPNPREGRMKEMFPTLGGMMMFYLTSHMMMHLGQVSAWRRCFGLGSIM